MPQLFHSYIFIDLIITLSFYFFSGERGRKALGFSHFSLKFYAINPVSSVANVYVTSFLQVLPKFDLAPPITRSGEPKFQSSQAQVILSFQYERKMIIKNGRKWEKCLEVLSLGKTMRVSPPSVLK